MRPSCRNKASTCGRQPERPPEPDGIFGSVTKPAPNRWIAPAEDEHPASGLGVRRSLTNVGVPQVVLLSALLDGDPDLLIEAISSGASPSYVYPEGWAPLHFAVEHCWPTLAAILLAVRADPNQPNKSGWTALHLAVDVA